MASVLKQELACGAPRVFSVGDWKGTRWQSSLCLKPFLLGVPTGFDSSRVSRRGRSDGEGTSSHCGLWSCTIQHLPTVCPLYASAVLGAGDTAVDRIGP